MDVLYVQAHLKEIVVLPQEVIAKLPKTITLFTTIQFINSKESMKKQLEDAGITVNLVRPRHARHEGQMLGCSTTKFDVQGDYFYVGDGLFHPKALLLRNSGHNVFTFNPKSGEFAQLDESITVEVKKKIIASYKSFLSAKNVGVLMTLKPGQYKEYMTKNLEEQFPEKNFYFFIAHTIDFSSLEDFPFINVFLNTMCERIGSDDMDVQGKKILNIEDLWDIQDGLFDK